MATVIHWPVGRYLSCFQCLVIINKAAVNICVWVFVWMHIFFCFFFTPGVSYWVFCLQSACQLIILHYSKCLLSKLLKTKSHFNCLQSIFRIFGNSVCSVDHHTAIRKFTNLSFHLLDMPDLNSPGSWRETVAVNMNCLRCVYVNGTTSLVPAAKLHHILRGTFLKYRKVWILKYIWF